MQENIPDIRKRVNVFQITVSGCQFPVAAFGVGSKQKYHTLKMWHS
jgi:hypothetical protein